MRSFRRIVSDYLTDTSVSFQDRSFIVFSNLVLIALYAAIPFGIIMREPLSATVSTIVGAIAFSAYVYYVFKTNRIARAKIVLSVVVVVMFLPAMFFSNGGALGGAPIWLLLGTIYIGLILEGRLRIVMLIVNAVILVTCWIIGYLFPEVVTEYTRGQNYFDAFAGLLIVGAIVYTLIIFYIRLFRREEKEKNIHRLFEQTATALANAIDAKDQYTHGHSTRVAEYSRKIAEHYGKSPAECDEIYQIALLHDVGKIGIDESIINKDGKLTDEEYATIKQHPVLGAQILKSITEYPNLIIGAKYHHERYDGKGYPDRLKGDDIPEIARIISVADAYDAMTSKRSYRAPIPQQTVREEIVKGSGTQFDPKFAKIMQHLIDLDSEYEMKEKIGVQELAGKNELYCDEFRDDISEGFLLGPAPTIKHIALKSSAINFKDGDASPAMILFDSLDGRYHDNPIDMKNLNYFEYATLRFDGRYECEGARRITVSTSASDRENVEEGKKRSTKYYIDAVKVKDHIQIKIDDSKTVVTITIALPDSARYAYIGLTGDNCKIYDLEISTEEEYVADDYIPRIAEEISFIKNWPVGDVPNIQMDGYRTDATEGIPVRDGMQLIFHTMSLPTARLIWHTAYIDLFYSADKKTSGEDYREYALIRLDGENWEAVGVAENKMNVNMREDFKGWDEWKKANKEGFDCTVSFKRDGNKIVTTTDNFGIGLIITTTILDDAEDVYVSLSGDQVALTNIRIITPTFSI
jgi:putative nucleotidyltransferase with HDIG domain